MILLPRTSSTFLATEVTTHLPGLTVGLRTLQSWLGHLFFYPIGILVGVLMGIISLGNGGLLLFELAKLLLAALQLPLQLLLLCQKSPLLIHAGLVLQLQLPQLGLQLSDLWAVEGQLPTAWPMRSAWGPCLRKFPARPQGQADNKENMRDLELAAEHSD